ncbi:MAG: hypothetical protein FJ296_05275 [Planctomycetes bacterium]|nr:hypothetical protein [Planctomycetota bacterium]
MSPARAPAVLLRLLLAGCALLGGLDLHGLEVGFAAHAAGAPDGGEPQAHGEDCSHREHVGPPHAHDCMVCKAAASRGAMLPPAAAARLGDVVVRRALDAGALPFARTGRTGTLGARGPPGPEA